MDVLVARQRAARGPVLLQTLQPAPQRFSGQRRSVERVNPQRGAEMLGRVYWGLLSQPDKQKASTRRSIDTSMRRERMENFGPRAGPYCTA